MNELATRINDAIRSRLAELRRGSAIREHAIGYGPILNHLPEFRVIEIEPTKDFELWMYCTLGAWEVDSGHLRQEFLLLTGVQDPANIEMLTMLANYHFDPANRVRVAQIIEIGDGLVSGSILDHILISVPYPLGDKAEYLDVGDICVRFLWTLPITHAEAMFANRHGIEALEKKFQEVSVPYWDRYRSSAL